MNNMERHTTSEWFRLDNPLAEPDVEYKDKDYYLERKVDIDGKIVWYGINTNWIKRPNEQNWTKLSKTTLEDCNEIPLYELMYLKIKKDESERHENYC